MYYTEENVKIEGLEMAALENGNAKIYINPDDCRIWYECKSHEVEGYDESYPVYNWYECTRVESGEIERKVVNKVPSDTAVIVDYEFDIKTAKEYLEAAVKHLSNVESALSSKDVDEAGGEYKSMLYCINELGKIK